MFKNNVLETNKQSSGITKKCFLALFTGMVALGSIVNAQAADKKLNVYVSFGYYGNTWMQHNRNEMTALAKSSDYKDKVNLHVQVIDNGDAQRQAQQINAMTEAGADVIVVYPSSPTALNRAIKNACRRGVEVLAWDSTVTETCATNVHADNEKVAADKARWIAKRIGGKGNVLMINGLNGTAASDSRVVAARKVWSEEYPNIKVVGEVEGKWSDPVVRQEVSKFMALRKWDDIDAAFAQLGCAPFYELQDEAGISDEDKIPCAGSSENSEMLAILPTDAPVEGATETYRARGIDGYAMMVGPAMGARTLKMGIDAKLSGQKLSHDVILPTPVVTKENIKLCKTGSWDEMAAGCNVFSPAMVPNPETNTNVYDADVPQVALDAALNAKPEK